MQSIISSPPRKTANGRLGGFCACLIAVLFVMVIGADVANAKTSAPQEGSSTKAMGAGLSCFTIKPAVVADPKAPVTCNDLCVAQEAVCTGVTSSWSPPQSCEDTASQNRQTCRCCKVRP